MKWLAVLLAGSLLTTTAWSQDVKKHALLVGVNKYQRRGFTDLQFAERDVQQLSQALTAMGFQCQVLTGSGQGSALATKANIDAQLDQMLGKVNKEDIVLVAFSGHGQQLEVKQGNQVREDQFYCPVDAVNRDPKSQFSISQLIDEQLAKRGGRNIVLIDACRDEPEDPGRGARGVQGRVVTLPEDTAILFSCRAGERSYERAELGGGHGLFTHCVLEALRGQRQTGSDPITWSDVVAHVNRRMRSDEIRGLLPAGVMQTPIQASVLPYLELGRPGSGPAEVTSQLGLRLKLVPAGSFRMGSQYSAAEIGQRFGRKDWGRSINARLEHPSKQVQIHRPFYLGIHEVTRGQFQKFVQATGYVTDAERPDATPRPGAFGYDAQKRRITFGNFSWKNPGFPAAETHPVINLSWNDANAFCQWLSQQEGRRYRLPSEMEWEYACRAGSTTLFHFGDQGPGWTSYANFGDRSMEKMIPQSGLVPQDDGHAFTAPVGSFAPNRWGFYDMHGNAAEWCERAYAKEKLLGDGRQVYRGGNWFSAPIFARSASRNGGPVTMRYVKVGFRVAMDAP